MSLIRRLSNVDGNDPTPPEILYKYVVPERVDILQHHRIRMSPPGSFNDPFEGYPHEAPYGSDEEILEKLRRNEHLPGVIHAIHEALYVKGYESREWTLEDVNSNFIAAYRTARDVISQGLAEVHANEHPSARFSVQWVFDRLLGILSLTEVNDDILMWGIYSRSHAGFVIGFNIHHEFFMQTGFGVRKVHYSDERPTIVAGDDWNMRFHLTKSLHWKHEKEWRLLTPLPVKSSEDAPRDAFGLPIILFDIPPSAFNRIILGVRMSRDDRDRLIEIAGNNRELRHVKFFQAQVDERLYCINVRQL